MRRFSVVFACVFCCLLPCKVFGDVAAIHSRELPQETAILAALDDVQKLEPYSHIWAMDWKYPVPKKDVARRLGDDLGVLMLASRNHPENAELQLLTGLVASYAYNLDVDGSQGVTLSALAEAEKLLPTDIRAPWFRAAFLCGTDKPVEGADEFLKIESGRDWDQLPASFWDDYMQCASVTSMPEHVLRAADHLEKLHAPGSEHRDFLAGIARKRFDPYDPKRQYASKDVWRAEDAGDDELLYSTMCGFGLRAHGNWQVNRLDISNGTCVAYLCSGPYKAITTNLRPCMLVIARAPKEGESLQDFSKVFLKGATFEPDDKLHCPVAGCIALKALQPGMYKLDGDGHGRVIFFERNEPEFPGLIFESPQNPRGADQTAGAHFYRPDQIEQRIPGKLYYLVLLDTAASIEQPALKDFDFFLQNLIVE